MHTNPSLIVFHEMGTGKTVTGLLCAIDFLRQDIHNTVYIVASKTLIANWEKELVRFVVDSSPLLSRISVGTIYDMKTKFKRTKFEPFADRHLMVIVDESHNYKSAYLEKKTLKSKKKTEHAKKLGIRTTKAGITMTTKKTIKLAKTARTPDIVTAGRRHRIMKKDSYFLLLTAVNIAKKMLFLTGTPFRNSIHDLKNMLQIIMILNDLSQKPTLASSPYNLHVTNRTEVASFMATPSIDLPTDEDIQKNTAEARIKINRLRNMIDYEKRSGDFPPYRIFYEMITPDPEFIRRFLKEKGTKKSVAFTRQRILSISLGGTAAAATAATAATAAAPVPDDTATTTTTVVTKPPDILSGKVQYLMGNVGAEQYELKYDDYIKTEKPILTRVPDLSETKSIIYSGLNIEYIEKTLPVLLRSIPGNEHLQIFFITGNVSKENREKARTEFNTLRKNAVLIISPAAKEGVDLKGVGHVFFIDGVWNPAEFEQIIGRAIRNKSHVEYPGVEVMVHILFDKHKEFPQEAMDTAVGKKYKVMKVFKDITADFNVEKDNLKTVASVAPSLLSLVPIELTQKQKYKTTFGIDYIKEEDDHLDLMQALCVRYTNSIYGPIPDNTAKIFSRIYNHEDYKAFETYFEQIRRIGDVDIILLSLEQSSSHDKVDCTHSSVRIKASSKTPLSSLKNLTLIMCSLNEGSFGHYGIFVFDPSTPDRVYYYDSMLDSNRNDNHYFIKFKTRIGKHFVLPATVIIDFPSSPPSGGYGPRTVYSMEITGGDVDVINPYVPSLTEPYKGKEKEWCIKLQALGSDNQNQFCYMWSILYMLCKVIFLKKEKTTMDWMDFIRQVCSRQILPLIVIKTFIQITKNVMRPEIRDIWTRIPMLSQYFPLVTTNATSYKDCFDMSKDEFDLYNIQFHHTSGPNLIDAWKQLSTHLKDIRLEKADLSTYKNDELRDAIINKLQPVLDHRGGVFDPAVPMTYPTIVHDLSHTPLHITSASLRPKSPKRI
jgi:superfamily II DNA or RNA helicase